MGKNKAGPEGGRREPYNQPIRVFRADSPKRIPASLEKDGISSRVARVIVKARLSAKMTQGELARALGWEQKEIARIESDAGHLTTAMLGRIARALKCRMEIRIVPR